MAKKTLQKPAKSAKKTKSEANKRASSQPRATDAPRKLKTPQYRSFRLQKRIKHPQVKLPNAFRLFAQALRVLGKHWKLFLGIVSIYGVLNMIFVAGLGNTSELTTLKSLIDGVTSGLGGSLAKGLTLFTYLLGSSGNTSNPTAGAYQVFLTLIISLVLIWALRQTIAGNKTTVRDAYYKSLMPFVPFLLVLCVVVLQLAPLLIGGMLYNTMITNGIAVLAVEKIVWALLFFGLALLSLYMVCSSIFALYIVTLPDMTPMKALRSARQLVLYRRWSVLRKVLFLPLALLVLAALIMLPIILFITPIAVLAFFALTMIGVAVIHSYMYTLYRSLL